MSALEDPRNIVTGTEIPTISYCDQPYIVKTDDKAWLCCVTTGSGQEGEPGQSVATMRSTDQGQTWSDPLFIEPLDGPEASYAVMLKAPGGRIYIFYNHNSDNLRAIHAERCEWFPEGLCARVDSLGYFVFKYSDDGGQSWSARRYPIPVREMDIDRKNPYGGKIRFFWNVGKPFIHAGAAYVSLHKVGGFGEGFFTRSEGVLLRSANLFTEPDPEKITWETLPDGDFGLRTPAGGGPIAEEQSYVVLSDGAFFATYRSIDGYPVEAYSRDGGHSWTAPQYRRYATGHLMKHPRAANFVWKCENGKYLYWFHNHGGPFIGQHARRRTIAYEDRNPVWLCGGIEADSPQGKIIRWSQPEIVLYDQDPFIRMSYPDLVEENGEYFLTETQKNKARIHKIAPALLAGLWGQLENHLVPTLAGPVFAATFQASALPATLELPAWPKFVQRDNTRADYGTRDLHSGISLELWARFDTLDSPQTLLDNRNEARTGFCLQTTSRGRVELVMQDGRTENRWESDPGSLVVGKLQHIVVVVDGGPKIITFIIDGILNDGGDFRQFGWGRFSPNLRGVSCLSHGKDGEHGDSELLQIGPIQGEIRSLRVYHRALRTSEAIQNYHLK